MQIRALTAGLLLAAIAAVFPIPTIAADENKEQAAGADPGTAKASGTVELESEQVRLIMGGTKGKGVLHFGGKDYQFTFKTASAGVGAKLVTKMSATGDVYSLDKVEDFAGLYTSISKTAMAGASTGTATYKNTKGVSIILQAKTKGVGLSFGGGSAVIELVEQ